MAVRAERARGDHPLAGAGALSRATDGKPVASLIDCRLETGRTHQIRVHLAHVGHPLLGDATYGTGFRTKASRLPPAAREALEALGRQALHAYLLASNTRNQGKDWSSDRNCRPISPVYITAWPPADAPLHPS